MALQSVVYLLFLVSSRAEAGDKDFQVVGASLVSCEQSGQTIQYSQGLPVFLSHMYEEFYFFGENITDLHVGITKEANCEDVTPMEVHIEDEHIAVASFETPDPNDGLLSKTRYYVCTKNAETNWTLENDDSLGFYVHEQILTTELLIPILLFTYSLSSLMSGLNIGLFTLNPNELEVLKGGGTAKERKYAKAILPVRRTGNFLLCSILITVTLCNAISTVTANEFFSEGVTVIFTTICIVLFCEILPQAVCTTYPLFVGANTIYITKACMLVTFPIAYPLGKILDWLFGKDTIRETYNKDRLTELLELTKLPVEELKIIMGTLQLSNKTVGEIMTKSNDMFKLPLTAVLDLETIATILASGYSRIPIYVASETDIRYIIFTKELALLDPDDNVPVKVLVRNEKLKCHYISRDTTVDKLLELFKDSRCHMVFVVEEDNPVLQDLGHEEDRNVIGLVTFEDVLEEIFQMEINDETDKYSDNRAKKKLDSETDLAKILKKPTKAVTASTNLKLAIFSFLSALDKFSKTNLSPLVLQKVLDLDIYFTTTGKKSVQDKIYARGVPADYFVMILEGEMEVKIGNEGLTFVASAFHYFGLDALKSSGTYTPDYILQGVGKAKYIKITKTLYEAAVLATQYERSRKQPNVSEESDIYKYYQKLVD